MAEILTPDGIQLPSEFTEADLIAIGKELHSREKAAQSNLMLTQWQIGLWWNALPDGKKAAICEESEINQSTAQTCGSIVSRAQALNLDYDKVRSFPALKILTAQGLTAKQADELLKQYRNNKWTLARLKSSVDDAIGKQPRIPLLGFDDKVNVVLDSLPASASKKVAKAIKTAMDDLRHDFEKEVHHVAQERVKEQRDRLLNLEKEVEQEKEALRNLRMNLDGLMTEEEYRLIRGCLHPDRAPEDRKSQFGKAFEIFTRLERSVNRDAPVKTRRARGWA